MTENGKTTPVRDSDLRRRAEAYLSGSAESGTQRAGQNADLNGRDLIHELNVHQIELEMQNEELRATQLELLESRERYSDLYNFAPVGYFTLTDRGMIEEMNHTGASLLGKPRSEIQGQPFSRFVASAAEDKYYLFLRGVRESADTQACDLELTKATGETFVASVEGRVVEKGEAKSGMVRLCVADATARVVAEAARLDKMESIGRLAGGIAHDFNNLLTGIAGNLAVLHLDADPRDEVADCLGDIQMALERAKKLTGQLLTFATGGEPVCTVVDIVTLLRDTARFTLTGSNSRCELQLPSGPIHVDADAGQISQVIGNLCMNATQAMPDGGTVTIRASQVEFDMTAYSYLPAGKYVRVSVQDSGMGVPAVNLKKVFDPFFTTKAGGHGLGLATAHSIIRNHGGHIECTSEPKVGTTFVFYLPLAHKQVPSVPPVGDEEVPRGSGRILVMDDEDIVRRVLKKLLPRLGYEVELTSGASEAIEVFMQRKNSGRPFDAVILDLTIPGGPGGKDVVRELLSIDPHLRALVCSGYSADLSMAKYREYGFCGVIRKPFTLRELGMAVAQALNHDYAQ